MFVICIDVNVFQFKEVWVLNTLTIIYSVFNIFLLFPYALLIHTDSKSLKDCLSILLGLPSYYMTLLLKINIYIYNLYFSTEVLILCNESSYPSGFLFLWAPTGL